MGNPLFNEGAMVPDMQTVQLTVQQLQGIGQIYLSSDEWAPTLALSSRPRQNPILHRLGARSFLTEPAPSSSGLFSHSSR